MNKFIVFIILVALGVVGWFAAPPVRKIVACYDDTRKSLDDLGFRSTAQGWDQRAMCEYRIEVVYSLKDCLDGVTAKTKKPFLGITDTVSAEFRRLLRPGEKTHAELKDFHNQECESYRDFQID